eukprot:COSAG01_NODE_5508_length_4212_cov_27.624449_6_plen_81_part_00
MVAAFVFVDKYTGPLGNASVEAALLVTLQNQQQRQPPPPPPPEKGLSSPGDGESKRPVVESAWFAAHPRMPALLTATATH